MKLINHDLQILYPTLLLFCICIYNLTAKYANYHGFSVKVRGSRGERGDVIFHNRKFSIGFHNAMFPLNDLSLPIMIFYLPFFMYLAKEGFGTGFQSFVLPIYSFARLDRTRRLYQGLLRNVFNWLPSLITSQSSTKPTYWIQLQICPKLCQWSHSRGQIFGLNIQIRQWNKTTWPCQ